MIEAIIGESNRGTNLARQSSGLPPKSKVIFDSLGPTMRVSHDDASKTIASLCLADAHPRIESGENPQLLRRTRVA